MKLRYDWSMYPDITETFIRIYTNTRTNLELKHMDITYAYQFCSDLEEYMNYLRNSGYDILKINEQLKSLLYVDFFKNKLRMDNNIIYLTQEQVIKTDKVIYLNEDIYKDERLTGRERRRLYLYKGLNKFLFNFNNDKTKEFSKIYSELYDTEADRVTAEALANSGWLLLEEVLSQELAEKITYESLNKNRPGLRPGVEVLDDYPIDGAKVSSKLEGYRPFEELIIRFGGTISGVGNMMDYSQEKIMDDLIDKALKQNLSDAIISEYTFNRNELELYIILYNMGLLINEKYATYGKRLVKNKVMDTKEINQIYDNLINIFDRLFTLDQDEYSDIPLKKVNNNIFVKKRIKEELK